MEKLAGDEAVARDDPVDLVGDQGTAVGGLTVDGAVVGGLATGSTSDAGSLEKVKSEGVGASEKGETSEGENLGTVVREGRGEAAIREVKGDGEGGIVLSRSSDDTEDGLDTLGYRKEGSYEDSDNS